MTNFKVSKVEFRDEQIFFYHVGRNGKQVIGETKAYPIGCAINSFNGKSEIFIDKEGNFQRYILNSSLQSIATNLYGVVDLNSVKCTLPYFRITHNFQVKNGKRNIFVNLNYPDKFFKIVPPSNSGVYINHYGYIEGITDKDATFGELEKRNLKGFFIEEIIDFEVVKELEKIKIEKELDSQRDKELLHKEYSYKLVERIKKLQVADLKKLIQKYNENSFLGYIVHDKFPEEFKDYQYGIIFANEFRVYVSWRINELIEERNKILKKERIRKNFQ